MNIDFYMMGLKKRLKARLMLSVFIIVQITIITFGVAGMAFSFDSLFSDKPEYLRYFDDEMLRVKGEFSENTLKIESLLESELVPIEKGVENNLIALVQEVKAFSSVIDGFSDAFNKNKYSIADSHLSTKRALYLVFSFFVIFYIKFLVDIYRHNANQASHDQAILDALSLCVKSEGEAPSTVDVSLLKDILPLLYVQYGNNEKADSVFPQLLSKIGGKT